jgi:cytochrome P450
MSAVRSPYSRTPWFNSALRFEPGRDVVSSQLDETKHTKRRAQLSAGYSGKENLTLESDIDTRLQELLHLIRSRYMSTDAHAQPFDIGKKIQFFALDVISTLGFGQSFGNLKADADMNDYIKSGEMGLTAMKFTMGLGLTPILQWPPISRLLGPSEKDKSGFGKMLATARGFVDARLAKSTEGRSDMLASFLRHGLSKEDVYSETVAQILAGSDTTATALRCTMMYLITHPPVVSKLRAEIDTAVSSNAASATGIASDACLRGMPYLQAVVHEALRVHPPVTSVVPKKVPKGGDTVVIDGTTYHLPGDANISYNAWSLHHDKTIFGDDAELFRPERWLIEDKDESSREQLVAMRRTTELIFGYGKYQCLGKPIAWLEITKVLFEVSYPF